MKQPEPRNGPETIYGSGRPIYYGNGTWTEAESRCYPSGGYHRRAYAIVRSNPHAPTVDVSGIVGKRRVVVASIPDTFYSIPAVLQYKGKRIRGYLSVLFDTDYLTWTPEATE